MQEKIIGSPRKEANVEGPQEREGLLQRISLSQCIPFASLPSEEHAPFAPPCPWRYIR